MTDEIYYGGKLDFIHDIWNVTITFDDDSQAKFTTDEIYTLAEKVALIASGLGQSGCIKSIHME